ncbi:MAG: TRAP transporter large permease [Planctomycetaceae bacterium]|nr:TRAP transporter large permease [Planctomycetaceae bacterium]
MTLGLLIVGMLVLLFLRVPVAFSMLLPCLLYVSFSPDITLGVALQRTMSGLDSFPLLAVPLFILTGYVSNAGGLADRLFRFLLCLLKRVPGSLGYVNVISSLLFSWMSGAAVADAAGLGSVLVPAMKKRGYDEGFSLGLTGASSLIGPMMPPSIPAIIYAVAAGVSVGGLFFASIVPALVLTAILCGSVAIYAARHPLPETEEVQGTRLASATYQAAPILLTPVIILGGILGGVTTPTEAAAVAAAYVIVLSGLFQSLSWKSLRESLQATTSTTGSIMLIVAAASLFGWIIAREQGPQAVTALLTSLTDNPYVFLLLVNIALLVVGMLLEPVAALLIMVPILMPAAREYGVDPLHLGVIMILNLVIGLLTPPVGLVLFVLSSVTGASVQRVIMGTLPFLLPLFATLMIVTYVPALSLWLPKLLLK